MKTAVFVYEVGQIPLISSYAALSNEYEIIAVGKDVEFFLEKQGIVFRSVREIRPTPTQERLLFAEKIGRSVFSAEVLPFFLYKGIHFGNLFTISLQYYLAFFLYYVDIVVSVLEAPYQKVIVFKSFDPVPSTAGIFGILGGQNTNFLPDAVELVCVQRSVQFEFLRLPAKMGEARTVMMQRMLFGVGISCLNFFTKIFIPQKKVRILASELWKNIGPLMDELPESELVLFDRMESFAAGLRSIIKYRMQFIHSDAYGTRTMRRSARTQAQLFLSAWNKTDKDSLFKGSEFRGVSLAPMLESVVGRILTWSEEVVFDIDATEVMIARIRPNMVLVRATASAQTHFAVLCEVARMHQIPSIEIQHGLLSPAPESFTKEHAAEYIAEYGPVVCKEWERLEYAPRSKFLDVGSPRFDEYRVIPAPEPKEDTFRILVISTSSTPGFWTDSYDVLDSYMHIAEVVRRIPGVFVTIKLRPDANRSFYDEAAERAFRDISYRVALSESFTTLLAETDVVISSHSTAMIEAMMSSRPVIYDASLPIFESFTHTDFAPHVSSGALIVTRSASELRDALVRLQDIGERKIASERVERFMKESYLFHDHQASKRLAEAIRQLARKK